MLQIEPSCTDGTSATGSGRGIGMHTARLLALLGARVYVTDLHTDSIAAAVDEIASRYSQMLRHLQLAC